MRKPRSSALLLASALVAMLVAALLATGCGDDGSPSPAPVTAAPTFAPDSTMAKILQRGKLVVGVKYDQPALGLLDPASGKPKGFDVSIALEIGHALGFKDDQIEFTETVSANRIPYLQEGRVDLVIATMTITADRKQQIDFSRPYYLAGQSVLVTRDAKGVARVDDLAGKRVCSVDGSTSQQTLKDNVPTARLVTVAGYAACVTALKQGQVDAVSTDDVILAGFAASDPSLKLVGGQFTKEPYGIGVKKGQTDLAGFIDGVIAAIFANGRWDRIYAEHFGSVAGFPPAAAARAAIPPTN